MENYRHAVQYYETDKMGITHHSNYIRWMEEARIDFLRQLGWDYARLEEEGMFSPVVGVECAYKTPTTFGDIVEIAVYVCELKAVKLVFGYEMRSQEGALVCKAKSSHCFLDASGKPLRLAKTYPELFQSLEEHLRP